MGKADLIISERNNECSIRVSGRANFECGMPLRSFAKNFSEATQKISIDLNECESMDSTFMGILTMLALRAKKLGTDLEILNASDYSHALLKGLGVEKMFKFATGNGATGGDSLVTGDVKSDKIGVAEAVVDAHKVLMDISLDNIAKFEKVVEFAQSDLDKLKMEAEQKK